MRTPPSAAPTSARSGCVAANARHTRPLWAITQWDESLFAITAGPAVPKPLAATLPDVVDVGITCRRRSCDETTNGSWPQQEVLHEVLAVVSITPDPQERHGIPRRDSFRATVTPWTATTLRSGVPTLSSAQRGVAQKCANDTNDQSTYSIRS